MTVPNPQPTPPPNPVVPVNVPRRAPVGGTDYRRPSTPDRETEIRRAILDGVRTPEDDRSVTRADLTPSAQRILERAVSVAAAREAERDTENAELKDTVRRLLNAKVTAEGHLRRILGHYPPEPTAAQLTPLAERDATTPRPRHRLRTHSRPRHRSGRMTTVDDLIAFLRARLDDSHERILELRRMAAEDQAGMFDDEPEQPPFDPLMVDLDAKRQIIEWSLDDTKGGQEAYPPDEIVDIIREATLTPVLKLLALPYADHPDYREEWRP